MSKQWGVVVGWWWGRSEAGRKLGAPSRKGLPVLSAFGGDAVGAVLGAGAAAFGHHGGPLAAVVLRWVGFGGGHGAHRATQTREQQGAARGGDLGVSGRGFQDQGAVGQLLFTPTPKGFHQMMQAALTRVSHESLV